MISDCEPETTEMHGSNVNRASLKARYGRAVCPKQPHTTYSNSIGSLGQWTPPPVPPILTIALQ